MNVLLVAEAKSLINLKGNLELIILIGYYQYLDLKIEPKKLVMGVPWYGYDYSCLNLSQVRHFPFNGSKLGNSPTEKNHSHGLFSVLELSIALCIIGA